MSSIARGLNYSRLAAAVVLGLCVGMGTMAYSPPAAAQTAEVKRFNLPAGTLDDALKQFGRQSGAQLLVPPELVVGRRVKAINGEFTSAGVLDRLLQGTGLSWERIPSGAIVIKKAQVAPNASPVAAPPTTLSPTEEKVTNMPEILVVGSKSQNVDIARTENDAQPYVIFDSETLVRSGAANLEDFLKQRLTSNTSFTSTSQTRATLNGGVTSSINLRGLGTSATLILVNGRRSAGVSLGSGATQPDINGIPISAVDRIEVLPSSASAIYGGAAVGGVVNVILKRQYTGGEISYSYDAPLSSDAHTFSIDGSYGFSLNEGKTQFLFGGHYSEGTPLRLGDRRQLFENGIARILRNSPSFLYLNFQPFSGATSNVASNPVFDLETFTITQPNLTLRDGTPLNSPITSLPVGASLGEDISSALLANAGTFNLDLAPSPATGGYGLRNAFGTVPTTSSIFASVRQEITDRIELFGEYSHLNNSGKTVSNPFSNPQFVPSSAPTNPFQQDVIVNFPTAVVAFAENRSETDTGSLGLVARLGRDWSTEFDYTVSENRFDQKQPRLDAAAFAAALADGTVNPFIDTIAYPPDVDKYVASFRYSGSTRLDDFALRASGPIGEMPAGRPTLTVGLGNRKESIETSRFSNSYPISTTSNNSFVFFGQSQSTRSIYAEALVPLVAPEQNISFVNLLDLQLAIRSEHYLVHAPSPNFGLIIPGEPEPTPDTVEKISYDSTNPTIAIKYEPVSGIAFRASYATAFLPPNVSQLTPNFGVRCGYPCRAITDPSNGETYLVDYTDGGNPELEPQRAKSWAFGVILEPELSVLRGLRVNLEYFSITQPNYIVFPTEIEITSDPAFSDRLIRDPITGLVTTIDLSALNATEVKTDGLDVKVDYLKSTRFGELGLHAAATKVLHDRRQYTISSPAFNYVGFPGEGGETKLKSNLTLDWEYGNWAFAWTATYYSGYWQINTPGSPSYMRIGPSNPTPAAQGSNTISSQTYNDLYASYTFDPIASGSPPTWAANLLSGLTISVGIKNIFDKAPPFDASTGYYSSSYGDPKMRQLRLVLKKSF